MMESLHQRKTECYLGLFWSNVIGMILELVASRVMAPYFGNSNFVWTAVIGIILLSGSIGNLIGGRWSEREDGFYRLSLCLMLASIVIMQIATVGNDILSMIRFTNIDMRLSSVCACIVLFLFPATILGIITPTLMNELLKRTHTYGHESGVIHAIAAIGSLVGTFAGGFWLIPFLGTDRILHALAWGTFLFGVCFIPISSSKQKILTVFAGVTFILLLAGTIYNGNEKSDHNDVVVDSIDTEYGRILVINSALENGEPIRLYEQSAAFSSAMFLDESKKYDLVFDYTKQYEQVFDFITVHDAMMIGGAAYSYPKYYIANHEGSMDVVEIDEACEKIARKYFRLNELYDEFDLDNNNRLNCITNDARIYLQNTSKKYDVIFNDSFSGKIPIGILATVEATHSIHDHLSDGGIYAANVIGSIYGESNAFLRSMIATTMKVFQYVYVIPALEGAQDGTQYGNYVVFASDQELNLASAIHFTPTAQDFIFTDDYYPVENLPDRT